MYDFPFPSADMLKRLPPITTACANKSIDFSQRTVSMMERFEMNLLNARITPKPGSAAQAFAIQGRPSAEAMQNYKSSMIITRATQNLGWSRCAM